MQVRIGSKVLYSCSFKRILYSICFCLFCVIDQRVRTCYGSEGWQETFRAMTGVVIAVVIMIHYKPSDFQRCKRPYVVWSIVGAVGCTLAFLWAVYNQLCLKEWFVCLLDVFLFGHIVIHTFISVAIEKKVPGVNRRFSVLWIIMLVLMILSRSNYIWPFCYLIIFGCFYLTDYDEAEQEDLFQGTLNGIILGFFTLQGLCFIFRPYDEVRYAGIYSNVNLNALFYLEVLAAILAKIVYVTLANGKKWIRICYWLGAGVIFSFLILTIGRTAWMTAFLLGLLFLWFLKKIKGKKNIIKNGIVLILCMCLMFPVCFGAVRYLPPVFHHPIWFEGEWSEAKVHSWDSWDSEKYVELDEFFESALGRIARTVKEMLEHSPFLIHVDAAGASEMVVTEKENYLLTPEEKRDSVLLRYTIYKYYATHLNLWGHPKEGQGFQATESYWVWHAHNIFLQYGTDFGIIVMVLFAIISVWSVLLLRKKFIVNKNAQDAGYLLFALIPIIYGVFECSWGSGTLSILMLFFAWGKAGRAGIPAQSGIEKI